MQGILLVNNWTNDVNDILDKIRINSIILSNEHKTTYFLLSSRIKWFRVPVIFLSALGSIFGIGLTPYLQQLVISEICSVMSLVVGLIGSLELFLAISTKMENELVQSKELYLLAIEIQKTLLLDVENRNGDGMAYLEDKFNVYSKLIENSYLLECKIMDGLTPLPNELQSKIVKRSSNSHETPPRPKKMPQRRSKQSQPIMDVNIMKHHRIAPLSPHDSSDVNKSSSPPQSPNSPPIHQQSLVPFSHSLKDPEEPELPRPTYSTSSIHKKKVLVDKPHSASFKPKQKQPQPEEVHLRPPEVHLRLPEVHLRLPEAIRHESSVASMNNSRGRRTSSFVRKSFVQLTDDEIKEFANRQYNSMRNKSISCDRKSVEARKKSCELAPIHGQPPIRRIRTCESISKNNSPPRPHFQENYQRDIGSELENNTSSNGYGLIDTFDEIQEISESTQRNIQKAQHALMSPTTPNWSQNPSDDPLTLPEQNV